MPESYIQVPADGAGKKTRTHTFTVNSSEVHHQIVENADFLVMLKVDSVDANISYTGKALPGALQSNSVWQIKKIDETSGVEITWADGNTDFDNVWNNRESLTYS